MLRISQPVSKIKTGLASFFFDLWKKVGNGGLDNLTGFIEPISSGQNSRNARRLECLCDHSKVSRCCDFFTTVFGDFPLGKFVAGDELGEGFVGSFQAIRPFLPLFLVMRFFGKRGPVSRFLNKASDFVSVAFREVVKHFV